MDIFPELNREFKGLKVKLRPVTFHIKPDDGVKFKAANEEYLEILEYFSF